MRIVIVEDNESLAKGIAYVLRDDGYAVDLLHDGAAAADFLKNDGADLVVLDINLPGQNGIEILRQMRRRNDPRPVLLLTARGSTEERVAGLDAGADDYLIKPFEMAELLARIRAMARRREVPVAKPVQLGDLQFDLNTRVLMGPNGGFELPRRELSVFAVMATAQGRTISKAQLLDAVYGVGADIDEKVVEVYISRLRKRLAPFGLEIKMQRGLGYNLVVASK